MKTKLFTLCMSVAPALLTGCATQPSISQLRQANGKVALVENGSQPLNFTAGVIDTSSFWGQYGGAIVGGVAGAAIDEAGHQAAESKQDQNRKMVKTLYGDSTLATAVNDTLLSKLAVAWNVPFSPATVIKVSTDKPVQVDPSTKSASSLNTDADMVLMTEVHNINLTERFSAGGALASGFTFGTNKKSLTTEVTVVMRALKKDAASGQYKEVWSRACGPNYTTMKTSYYLEDLAQDSSKMREVLDEATTQTLDYCTKAIDAAAKS